MIEARTPEFRLMSHTQDPLETIFAVWAQSRPTQFQELFDWLDGTWGRLVLSAPIINDAVAQRVIPKELIKETFKKISAMDLPITESIHFTWGFSSLPIEWREQAVSKRQWGFWLTSMREFTMEDFVEDGRFCPPPEGTVSPESVDRFYEMINTIQGFYCELQSEYNWPPEKARKVVPLCATHNGTMFSNLRTLLNTVSARTCWVAQLDIWAPVLQGMISELQMTNWMLGQIVSPPCFSRYENEFKGCKYCLINENRCTGKDMYAPCPLYLNHEMAKGEVVTAELFATACTNRGVENKFIKDGLRLIPLWQKIWNRNPFTGILF